MKIGRVSETRTIKIDRQWVDEDGLECQRLMVNYRVLQQSLCLVCVYLTIFRLLSFKWTAFLASP